MIEYALLDNAWFGELEDTSKFDWIVYNYQEDAYEGYGFAVLLGKDGKLYFHNMGHCSCYGPFDKFPDGGCLTKEEFLSQGNSALDEVPDDVREMCEQLLKV